MPPPFNNFLTSLYNYIKIVLSREQEWNSLIARCSVGLIICKSGRIKLEVD